MTEKTKNTSETVAQEMSQIQVVHDLKNSVLIVSVVANLFVLIAWVMLQVTTQYDSQFVALLFNR